MVGEEKRHQMMQNLFGDQSEEEPEEVESEHESNRQPDYASDEGDGVMGPEGQEEIEGHRQADMDSEDENQDVHVESEGERDKSSQEVAIPNQRDESEERYSESGERQEYGHRNVSSRRQTVIESGSERSGDSHYIADEDDEVNQDQRARIRDEKDEDQFLQSAPEIRDVFGESDDEEPVEYDTRNQMLDEENRSPMGEEEDYVKDFRPEDMVRDEDMPYDSEEERLETKPKDKPFGPPLELEIPLCPPPAPSSKMNMIKVSNIMGVDPRPFDAHAYVEEDFYVTDESGLKKRIRLENNVVRWRKVKKSDGTTGYESNARFVEWSDGSLQLLIGNEVLDISKQDAQSERAHLFLRHGKGFLQSQGQILSKMRFMPSSLASNSHRLLTALVDSRHKKVYKVKNCITDIDPEKEKEQQEKAVSQTIKANELLSRKKEKVTRKYTQPFRRERQLSPGFLEDALDEEDDQDYYEPRRSAVRRRFEEDLEQEARAEKRIISAKKGSKNIPRKPAMPVSKSFRRPVDFSESEKEESEYETEEEEEDEGSPARGVNEEELDDREEEEYVDSEEEAEEPKHKARSSAKRKGAEGSDAESPRKLSTRRRMKIVYDSDDE